MNYSVLQEFIHSLSERDRLIFMSAILTDINGSLGGELLENKFNKLIKDACDKSMIKLWSWLLGGSKTTNDLIYEVYNSDGTDVAEYMGRADKDYAALGNMLTTVILYLGLLNEKKMRCG